MLKPDAGCNAFTEAAASVFITDEGFLSTLKSVAGVWVAGNAPQLPGTAEGQDWQVPKKDLC